MKIKVSATPFRSSIKNRIEGIQYDIPCILFLIMDIGN